VDRILARTSVSIAELKNDPARIINEAEGAPIAILDHNKPSAYLIPAETYEELMRKFEDFEFARFFNAPDIGPTERISGCAR